MKIFMDITVPRHRHRHSAHSLTAGEYMFKSWVLSDFQPLTVAVCFHIFLKIGFFNFSKNTLIVTFANDIET